MEYKNWKLRKEVMGEEAFTPAEKFACLVVIDSVDWYTGEKRFGHKRHFVSWLHGIAFGAVLEKADIEIALKKMIVTGYAVLDTDKYKVLQLTQRSQTAASGSE